MTDRELDQLKLICEYIKFHIGLYLATPPALMVVAEWLKIVESKYVVIGTAVMMFLYLLSGISAGLFMGAYVNKPWNDARLEAFRRQASSTARRVIHQWFYWLGLAVGISGLIAGSLFR